MHEHYQAQMFYTFPCEHWGIKFKWRHISDSCSLKSFSEFWRIQIPKPKMNVLRDHRRTLQYRGRKSHYHESNLLFD